MARHPLPCLPFIRWKNLCSRLVCVLPLALCACQSQPPKGSCPQTGQETDVTILLGRPAPQIDILFLIDNSPTMASKQAVLAQNFPKMIQVLQNLPASSGGVGLPDVHIGVVSSDMGAGSEPAGSNWRYLGDRGLLWGNDSNNPIASVAGPPNNGCGLNAGARWIEDIESPDGIGRQKNYTGNLADVFSCLASAVGVSGSSFPHQLQALRVALNPQQVNCDAQGENCTDINMENIGFLRDKAYLAIIIITDEDDCSASPDDTTNNGMFQAITPGDTGRLRCAARGHVCNGQPIPDYDPATGYAGQGFTANLSDCAAKDQLDPSQPDPAYLPLIRVQDVIDSVNNVKVRPQDQIAVSGIIGWPTNDDLSGVQYQIGKDVSAPSPQDTLWDYLPICEVPSITSPDGNIYKAYGGLRLKQFIDGFRYNGAHFSICNTDFTYAMTMFGSAMIDDRRPACIVYPLIDTDPGTPDTQPDCQVVEQIACETPGQGDCLSNGYRETLFPECKDPVSGLPLNPADSQLESVPDDNRPCWYLYYDPNPMTGCPNAFNGQRITVLFKTGQVASPDSLLTMRCLTRPDSVPECVPQPQ